MSNKLLVGRYELLEKIGEGGMAVVYKSRDRLLNRFVAIKILRPEFTKDAQFVDSFRKESQAAAGLQHPNIVSVYDVGKEGNIHFIVMELVDGKPLSEVIAERAPMDYRQAIEFTKQVASALSLAHKHNIIHRDIKPHNIMITEDNVAKLGDFGIAKAVSDSTLTETSKIIGSVHYFSPEQARGAYVDERSDIYSLGIVLYEMLTGKVPFDGDNPVQVALMHINDDIVPPTKLVPGIPPQLEKLVMKATDKFQTNRYKSADELLEDIQNIEFVTNMVGDSIFAASDVEEYKESISKEAQAKPAPIPQDEEPDEAEEKKGKGKKKKKWLIPLIIILLLAAGIVGALFATGQFGSVGKITVPDVTDLSYDAAKAKIEAAELKIEKGDDVVSDEVKKGNVVKQDPKANRKVKKGTVVTVNLSAGKSTGAVPNLVGKYYDKEDIETLLKSSGGFELGTVDHSTSDQFEKGQIISQNPSANTVKEKGTRIDIVVCDGPKTIKYKVPAVTGLTAEQAIAKIEGAGFTPGEVKYEESTAYSEGYVMWQQYEAGTELKKGSSISIKVSKGSPNAEPEPEPDSEEEGSQEGTDAQADTSGGN